MSNPYFVNNGEVLPPAQGYPPQGYVPQGYPPQGYPPQGYPPQGYPSPLAGLASAAETAGMNVALDAAARAAGPRLGTVEAAVGLEQDAGFLAMIMESEYLIPGAAIVLVILAMWWWTGSLNPMTWATTIMTAPLRELGLETYVPVPSRPPSSLARPQGGLGGFSGAPAPAHAVRERRA